MDHWRKAADGQWYTNDQFLQWSQADFAYTWARAVREPSAVETRLWTGSYMEDGWRGTLSAIDTTFTPGHPPTVSETWRWTPPRRAGAAQPGAAQNASTGAAAQLSVPQRVNTGAGTKAKAKAKAKANAKTKKK